MRFLCASVLTALAATTASAAPLRAIRVVYRPGYSLAADGSKLLIGAADEYDSRAYFVDAPTGTEVTTVYPATPIEGESYAFGYAIAPFGSDVLVSTTIGQVYLFDGTTGALLRAFADPHTPTTFAWDHDYARSVASACGHVFAGADLDDAAGEEAGAVYAFDGATGALLGALAAPHHAAHERFGDALAATDTIIAASVFGIGGAPPAIHLFDACTLAWVRTITMPDSAIAEYSYSAVAAVGDRLLVGAPNAEGGAGAAYLFDLSTGDLLATFENPFSAPFSRSFGSPLAIVGEQLVVEAFYDSDPHAQHDGLYDEYFENVIHVFDATSSTPVQSIFGNRDNHFGISMTALGRGIAVSTNAPYYGGRSVVVYSPCGDGIVDVAERCDDGNLIDGDGCNADCTPTCGDGVVAVGEACDDGNRIDGDGCDRNCTPTGCGNGIVTAGEECDDGNNDDHDSCTNACTFAVCGDGVVQWLHETCDDGNLEEADGCDADCTPSYYCVNGGRILRPSLRIDKFGPPWGDEELVFKGTLALEPGRLTELLPALTGAQVRIGFQNSWVTRRVDSDGLQPEGSGPYCGYGWVTARNRSTYHDTPDCTSRYYGEIPALGMELIDARGRHDRIKFTVTQTGMDEVNSYYWLSPVRATIVLGASNEASMRGDCGAYRFDPTHCRFNAAGTRLHCRG